MTQEPESQNFTIVLESLQKSWNALSSMTISERDEAEAHSGWYSVSALSPEASPTAGVLIQAEPRQPVIQYPSVFQNKIISNLPVFEKHHSG